MVFACCHPALPRESQIALTLRAVCGLSTAQIAAAFLVAEPAMTQRLLRARKALTAVGRDGKRADMRVPDPDQLAGRLAEVAGRRLPGVSTRDTWPVRAASLPGGIWPPRRSH